MNQSKLISTTVQIGNQQITVQHGRRLRPEWMQYYADKYYNNGARPHDYFGRTIPFLVWLKSTYGWDLMPV